MRALVIVYPNWCKLLIINYLPTQKINMLDYQGVSG